MSKMDELRALREARYQQEAASAAKPASARKASAPQAPRSSEASSPEVAPAAAKTGLCGHRSMNGRTCTREHGHSAKSHRYS